jgi:hypothetical protein
LRRSLADHGFDQITMSARHIYLIVGDRVGRALSFLPFQREMRFKTKSHFWHLSRFARVASGLWSDTLIAVAKKSASPQTAA